MCVAGREATRSRQHHKYCPPGGGRLDCLLPSINIALLAEGGSTASFHLLTWPS